MTKTYPITTVGVLKEILKDLPNNAEIDICNTGSTGFIDSLVELEVNTWENSEPYICLNIKAESGFH